MMMAQRCIMILFSVFSQATGRNADQFVKFVKMRAEDTAAVTITPCYVTHIISVARKIWHHCHDMQQ